MIEKCYCFSFLPKDFANSAFNLDQGPILENATTCPLFVVYFLFLRLILWRKTNTIIRIKKGYLSLKTLFCWLLRIHFFYVFIALLYFPSKLTPVPFILYDGLYLYIFQVISHSLVDLLLLPTSQTKYNQDLTNKSANIDTLKFDLW